MRIQVDSNVREWNLEFGISERSTVGDDNIFSWLVTGGGFGIFNCGNDIHTLDNFTEHNVTVVQPWGQHGGDEELRSIGILASVGHAQKTDFVMLEGEVFVSKTSAVDWTSVVKCNGESNQIIINNLIFGFERNLASNSPASAISSSEVTTLDHETFDDTMELAAFVSEMATNIKLN